MKSVFVLLCSAGLWAQTPQIPPPPVPPAAFSNPPVASPAPAAVAPETVVAEVDGKKYTAGEVTKLLQGFPPQMAQQVRSNPQQALSYVLTMTHLAAEAEKAKLDQSSPLKETLEYQRMNVLAQAQINQVKNYQFNPSPEDEEKYYKAHPDKYEEAKLKVIYVAFSTNPATGANAGEKKPLTESEAKAKIEDLRKKLMAGGDFAQLAKENSDDKDSAAKGGDFPSLKRTSAYPDAIKKAIFALKPSEISEPIQQPNGFYLLRLEQMRVQPFEEVRVQIYEEMKNADFSNWFQALQKRYEVKVENPAYFASKPAAPAAH